MLYDVVLVGSVHSHGVTVALSQMPIQRLNASRATAVLRVIGWQLAMLSPMLMAPKPVQPLRRIEARLVVDFPRRRK
jgi:hypothetical protein